MSTWNSITIETPGDLTLDTLPDALTSDGEIWENYSTDDERETIPERILAHANAVFPERAGDPEGSIIISGRSKWRPDEAIAALIGLSKTTGRITHRQEWDDDEQGASLSVYENGAEVESERQESALVPANLRELVANVRSYVRRDHRGDIQTEMGAEPMQAVMALVDALDPAGAQA